MPEWLTYAQAGARFGVSPDALRMRAHRLGWRTQPGNDGRTLVQVPDDAEVSPRARSPERSSEHAPEHAAERATLIASALAALEDAVATLRERAEIAERRADAADTDRRAAQARL